MISQLISTAVKWNFSLHRAKKTDVIIKDYTLPILNETHERPLKIVHISDLHIGFNYEYEDLLYHIHRVNQQNADVVVISGDLFDRIDIYKGNPKKFIPLLKTIKAKQGIYFCFGNHDQRTYQTEQIKEVLEASEIQLLNNFGRTIYFDDEPIYICGLDDILNSKGNVRQALNNRQHPSHTTITLVHEPDYADFVKRYKVDLQLSGHSHGGQIRLPLFGAIVTPKLARKYIKGLYTIKNKYGKLIVHVSPGLGTTHLPIRFFCPPEITVLNLIGKKK